MVADFLLLAVFLAAHPALASPPERSFDQIAQQADAARTADKTREAIRLYREGVRLRPSWSEGWWSLGSLLYDQDRFREAATVFQRFVTTAQKPGPAYAFLGLCEYELKDKDYDRALQHFREWARTGWAGTPELADVAVFHFALLLTRESRFVEALYLLATLGDKLGDSPGLTEAMGLASLRMASLPETYPPESRDMVWLAGKAAFYGSGHAHDFARADEYAGKLLLHYEHEPNVHYFRGTLFNFVHKRDESAEEFRRELQISPQHVPAMIELAGMYLSGDQLAEAVLLARRSSEIEPKNPAAHHVLGQALFTAEQFQESVRELQTAKQLAPDGAMIRFHLARAYTALGRKQEAQQEVAAFKMLKGKEQVLAPPKDKLGPQLEPPR